MSAFVFSQNLDVSSKYQKGKSGKSLFAGSKYPESLLAIDIAGGIDIADLRKKFLVPFQFKKKNFQRFTFPIHAIVEILLTTRT